jgi:uncharacterized protein YjbI with pentapeptide repeats
LPPCKAYLDQISYLLLEKDLRNSEENSDVRTLARARTRTVLGRLDPSRKTAAMQFLVEAELVQRVENREPIIRLSGANLSDADLSGADLSSATGVTNEELEQQAESNGLEGATMPNGQKYEDWLKSKGHGEDGENTGPS